MVSVILDQLLARKDVTVDAFAMCEVRRGLQLAGGAGATIAVHYVLSGTMYLTVPGQPQLVCGPGSVVIVPPGLRQVIAADSDVAGDVPAAAHGMPLRGGMLLFDAADGAAGDLRVLCGLVRADRSSSFGLLDAVHQPIVVDMGDIGAVRRAYATMREEIDGKGLGSRALIGALMTTCLILMLRRHIAGNADETSVLSTLRNPRLGKAITAVLDRPAGAHSVASLARTAGMSRSAFAREFARTVAMGPMAFVARTRLHHAADLLTATGLPVKAIAASVGFASRSHFSRAFTATYGADPSGFRSGAKNVEGVPAGAPDRSSRLIT